MNDKKLHFQGVQKGNKILSMELPRNVRLSKETGEEADLEISTLNKIYPAMESHLQSCRIGSKN